jgi:hypothetical protein
MGFGKKTDFESGRTLDLDKSYRSMIKPAVEAAGLECIRADEIVHSGLIDVPMYQQLLNADVVVADLSTSNKNAFYELGVRHALRPYTTVVIAEEGMKTFPFDVNHVVIRQYRHLGDVLDIDDVMRFREELTKAIVEISSKEPADKRDSPVYAFLDGLNPPNFAAAQAVADKFAQSLGSTKTKTRQAKSTTHSMLMQKVDDSLKDDDFPTAKKILSLIREMMKEEAPTKPEDPYIIQRLALITYKGKLPSEEASLVEARQLLAGLDPETSNDTETLGLWGSIHKHLWEITEASENLDTAVRSYERGFYLRNDSYNGINVAYLLNARAAHATDPAEAIADFVLARRIRKEVLTICERWMADNPPATEGASDESQAEYQKRRYWMLATMAEAHLGLGDEDVSRHLLEEAFKAKPEKWMKNSTQAQIKNLKELLKESPLKYVSANPK